MRKYSLSCQFLREDSFFIPITAFYKAVLVEGKFVFLEGNTTLESQKITNSFPIFTDILTDIIL